jgi:hypothetical protein
MQANKFRKAQSAPVLAVIMTLAFAPLVRAEGELPQAPAWIEFVTGRQTSGRLPYDLLENDTTAVNLQDTFSNYTEFSEVVLVAPKNDYTPTDFSAIKCSPTNHTTCVNQIPWGDGENTHIWTNVHLATDGYNMSDPSPIDNVNGVAVVLSIKARHYIDLTVEIDYWAANYTAIGFCQRATLIINATGDDKYRIYGIPKERHPWYPDPFSYLGWPDCNGGPWTQAIIENLIVYVTNAQSFTTPPISMVSASFRNGGLQTGYTMDARPVIPAVGHYPVRAEWTCETVPISPYYLQVINETLDARDLGTMCPSIGDYSAPLLPTDIQEDGRVHYRIHDEPSAGNGALMGNLTLNRLVAVLTADFPVTVANFSWLLYLFFMIGALLIAAWGVHKIRERAASG